MTKITDIPAIRFKGFSDTWEQRKLGENIVEYTEKTTENNQYPVLTSSRKGIFFQTDYYDGNQIASADNTGYNIVPYGYFTYRHMSDDEIFHFNINDIAENGIVSTLYPVFTTDENLDSRYLQYQLNYGREFAKYAILQKQGGSRTYMYLNKLKNLYITVPTTIEEQKKISEFFTNLDHLITLHQRKYDKLTNVKKSMLEKMFPQNGSNVPEIRFKGFTEAWEQRKLGEIGSVSMCRRIFKEQTSENGEIPFYKIGTFGGEADAFISRELFEEYKAKYQYPKKGDILISASGSIGRTVVFTGKNEYFQDSNIVWLNHDKHLDNSFLKCFYSIVKWAGIEGSTIKRLYNDNILNTAITLPSVEEQQKIGAYFENLDNLITLHQREFAFLCKEKSKKFRYIKNAWEQRKLGELAVFNPKEEIPDVFEYVDLESVVDTEMLSHRTEEKATAPSRAQRLAHTGDLFYQTVRPYQKNNYLFEKPDKHYVFSTGYAQLRPFIDGYFLLSLVQNWQFVKTVLDNCTGTSYPAINANDLAEIEVFSPKDEQEHHQIGTYFRNLDNLITLHQRKPNFYTGGYYAE